MSAISVPKADDPCSGADNCKIERMNVRQRESFKES